MRYAKLSCTEFYSCYLQQCHSIVLFSYMTRGHGQKGHMTKVCLSFYSEGFLELPLQFFLELLFFFQLLYLESGFFPQLTLRQLIQPDLESRFIVRSHLGPSIQSGSFTSAGLQVVTQFTHLSKDCYPQLVSNPHRSKIRSPQQLDYRCMPLHPCGAVHNRARFFGNHVSPLKWGKQAKPRVLWHFRKVRFFSQFFIFLSIWSIMKVYITVILVCLNKCHIWENSGS